MQIKLVDFNIRCCDDSNGYSIAQRAPRLQKITSAIKADVITFQEHTPLWEQYIKSIFLPEYDIYNVYRAKDELESSPILWRKDRFDCVYKNRFWLSDTPETESRGWDEVYNCYRMCIHIKLKEKSGGKTVNIINTHFGFGNEGQIKSINLVKEYCAKFWDEPVCIAGDFNMEPDSDGYREITKYFSDVNALTLNDWGDTYHGYAPGSSQGEHVDYCFINDFITAKKFKLLDNTVEGKYPSDHFGLLAYLEV